VNEGFVSASVKQRRTYILSVVGRRWRRLVSMFPDEFIGRRRDRRTPDLDTDWL